MTESKIKTIESLNDYRINIFLENGHCIIYNIKPRLETARFHDLYNPDLFSRGHLNKWHTVQRDYHMELSLNGIIEQVTDGFMNYEWYSTEKQKG